MLFIFQGRDNLGHTISVSETTLSPEFLADGVVSKILDSNEMTPIPISIKMGKRVAIGVDSIIVLLGEFFLFSILVLMHLNRICEIQQQDEYFNIIIIPP